MYESSPKVPHQAGPLPLPPLEQRQPGPRTPTTRSRPDGRLRVVLRYLPDVPIHVVVGHERTIKVTYPADLAIAEVLRSQIEP